MHEVLQAWTDSSEAHYTPTCPHCGNELSKGFEARRCEHCHKRIDPDMDFDMLEPDCFTYEKDGYQCQQSGDDTDIFVIKSPFFTYCQFCSPCAPGAGYLMNWFKLSPMADGTETKISDRPETFKALAENAGFPKTYCFGHDFFDDNRAPYPVFSVATGEIVNP